MQPQKRSQAAGRVLAKDVLVNRAGVEVAGEDGERDVAVGVEKGGLGERALGHSRLAQHRGGHDVAAGRFRIAERETSPYYNVGG